MGEINRQTGVIGRTHKYVKGGILLISLALGLSLAGCTQATAPGQVSSLKSIDGRVSAQVTRVQLPWPGGEPLLAALTPDKDGTQLFSLALPTPAAATLGRVEQVFGLAGCGGKWEGDRYARLNLITGLDSNLGTLTGVATTTGGQVVTAAYLYSDREAVLTGGAKCKGDGGDEVSVTVNLKKGWNALMQSGPRTNTVYLSTPLSGAVNWKVF